MAVASRKSTTFNVKVDVILINKNHGLMASR